MTHQQPPSIDYRTPAATGSFSPPIFSLPAFIAVLLPSLALFVAAIVTRHFEPIFRDFKTELPAISKLMLLFSWFCLARYGWAILLAIVICVPFLWALAFPAPPDPARRRVRLHLAIVLIQIILAIVIIFTFLALFAPMMSLIQTVSPPSAK